MLVTKIFLGLLSENYTKISEGNKSLVLKTMKGFSNKLFFVNFVATQLVQTDTKKSPKLTN